MKKFKNIFACLLVVCTAGLALVGCGKKEDSYKDFVEAIYYGELADSYSISTKANLSIDDEPVSYEQTQKIVSDENGVRYYSSGKNDGEPFNSYEEYVKTGLFYEHKTYMLDELSVTENGKVYSVEKSYDPYSYTETGNRLYTLYGVEEARRLNELSVLSAAYSGEVDVPYYGEASLADIKVKGSKKKFTLTASITGLENLDSGTVVIEVAKKKIVSCTVDIKFKPMPGQETADYCKQTITFSYTKAEINFDTSGYAERIDDSYNYLEPMLLPNENFKMTVSSGEGAELTVSTIEYSVAADGKICILLKSKQGEQDEVIDAYIEYAKISDDYYSEAFYADGTGTPTTREDILYFNLQTVIEQRLGEEGLYTLPYIFNHCYEVFESVYSTTESIMQEGSKSTFTKVASLGSVTNRNVTLVVVNGKVTGGSIVETSVDEVTNTTTYTYTYNTPAVSYTPTAAAD